MSRRLSLTALAVRSTGSDHVRGRSDVPAGHRVPGQRAHRLDAARPGRLARPERRDRRHAETARRRLARAEQVLSGRRGLHERDVHGRLQGWRADARGEDAGRRHEGRLRLADRRRPVVVRGHARRAGCREVARAAAVRSRRRRGRRGGGRGARERRWRRRRRAAAARRAAPGAAAAPPATGAIAQPGATAGAQAGRGAPHDACRREPARADVSTGRRVQVRPEQHRRHHAGEHHVSSCGWNGGSLGAAGGQRRIRARQVRPDRALRRRHRLGHASRTSRTPT